MRGAFRVDRVQRCRALGWAAALVLFAGAGLAVVLLPPPVTVAVLAAAAVVLGWLIQPKFVVAALLLVRSSVDGVMELFTLFAGSPLSMNLSGAANSLAVGLGLLALARRWLRRQPLFPSPPGKAYLLLLIACVFSIPGSIDPVGGVKEWARLASGLAVYLLVADVVHGERQANRFVGVILASSLVPLAVAWLQRVAGVGYFFVGFVGTEFAFRPQGTFVHPAALGSYLVLLLTLATATYFSAATTRLRLVLLAWASLAAGALVLTLARAQWLGMMVAALWVGLVKRRRLAALALLAALLLMAMVPLLRERLTASESIDWRMELWQAAGSLAWPPSWLGKGLATAHWHINQILPKVDAPPHNDYLKFEIETGLVGLLAYGLWSLVLMRHAWRAYRLAQAPALAWRALSLMAVVGAGMVMSLADNYLGYTAVQWYLWALVALVPPRGRWPAAPGAPLPGSAPA